MHVIHCRGHRGTTRQPTSLKHCISVACASGDRAARTMVSADGRGLPVASQPPGVENLSTRCRVPSFASTTCNEAQRPTTVVMTIRACVPNHHNRANPPQTQHGKLPSASTAQPAEWREDLITATARASVASSRGAHQSIRERESCVHGGLLTCTLLHAVQNNQVHFISLQGARNTAAHV